ncbi:MAG: DUF1189 domain-containing protein, partial [Candidatus Obscuribacterales bacterium]|nr:DUF1189 domain-containing protein [Candidatus Obscuribacterales bacterium]
MFWSKFRSASTAFKGLYRCFYSVEFYRSVARDWKGLAPGFLFLVSMLFAVLVAGGEYLKVLSVLQRPEIQSLLHSLPEM